MDRIDFTLSLLLLANSRTPYRNLAEKLGLSINAVHKRVQEMVNTGVIRGFVTKLNLVFLGATHVVVFGHCDECSYGEISAAASTNDRIYWTAMASGNILYVGAYLKDMNELNKLGEFVSNVLKIRDLTIGIEPMPKVKIGLSNISTLDFQIIASLQKNSRKQISDIAEELKVSTKTVQRRISRLEEKKVIDFTIEWYPDVSNDILSVFHCRLKPDRSRDDTLQTIQQKYSPHMIFGYRFSNLPQQLIFVTWTTTMKELQDLRKALGEEVSLSTVMPNVVYIGTIFQTWRDKLVTERAAGG